MQHHSKIAYVCKQMWESDDALALELYPSPEDLPADHRECGIVQVRVTPINVVRESNCDEVT